MKNLRKSSYLIAFALFLGAGCALDAASSSFFMPRSVTHDPVYELASVNYYRYHQRATGNGCCPFFTFGATPFFTKSVKAQNLARHFLFDNKNELVFNESGAEDINSIWFNLIAAPQVGTIVPPLFNSVMKIRPERMAYGSMFNFHFDFSNILRGFWFDVNFAAMRVKHDLKLTASRPENPGIVVNTIGNTATQIETVIDALNNPEWKFGKWSDCALSKFGVDDVQLKFGYDNYNCHGDHLGTYFVISVPTGNRQKSEFVFEPVVGTKHTGLGFGMNIDYALMTDGDRNLSVMFDGKYRYLVTSEETRSFDLNAVGTENRDWSRYLLIEQGLPDAAAPTITNPTGASEPGINDFTLEVDVTPRSTIDLWGALHYARNEFNFEIGYSFWWRDKEDIKFKKSAVLDNTKGIFDMLGVASGAAPLTSTSTATIQESVIPPTLVTGARQMTRDLPSFIGLPSAGLDADSAAHPKVSTHKVYATFAYAPCMDQATLLSVGGSYEFAPTTAALEQWSVWFNAAISF